MSRPTKCLAIVLFACTGCGGMSSVRGSSLAERHDEIRVTQVACYVVCDSLQARILADGMVVRREGGAILGPDRVGVRRQGADTVTADAGSLDSLRASLAEVEARGLAGVYRQGVLPCNAMVTTHTPVVSINWGGDANGARSLTYDTGCRQESGLLDATVRYAQQAALFRGIPVREPVGE